MFGVVALLVLVSGLLRLVASDHLSPIDQVFLPANDTNEFETLPIETLYEYHDELQRLLQAVNYQIAAQTGESVDADDATRRRVAKRAVGPTVSASLPHRNSSFFLDRIAERNSSSSAELTTEEGHSTKEDENDDEETSTFKSTPDAETTTHKSSSTTKASIASSEHHHSPKADDYRYDPDVPSASRRFKPLRNRTAEECIQLSQTELVSELKEKGTYNPDFMAWDVPGVIRFLDKTVVDQYERDVSTRKDTNAAVEKNLNALERILRELDVHCDVRSPEVIAKLYNLTTTGSSEDEEVPRRSVSSPSMRRPSVDRTPHTARHKRAAFDHFTASLYLYKLYGTTPVKDDVLPESAAGGTSRESDSEGPAADSSPDAGLADGETPQKRQKIIGQVHVVPFGCDKRGTEEDGYLRLCGACQAIRRLPDDFFPPFINEVMCDEDKACLYFYDYPHGKCKQKHMNFVCLFAHGKCKQKHMNFVVLRNIGSPECQVWRKFNLNVRVSCECFVDEMSFFAKYV